MNKKIHLYLIVALVIVLFDAAASVASRVLQFDYTNLMWVSWGLYIAIGFLGCLHFDLMSGVSAGFIAGLSDSTVGWVLSSVIGPYLPFAPRSYSIALILVAIAIVCVMGTFFGLIGALSCKLFKRIRRRGQFADA
jgi:hypothetical protein